MILKFRSILVIFSVFLLSLQACAQFNNNTPVVSPSEVYRMLENNENILVVDVRTEGEYNGELGHIENAILRPLQEMDHWKEEFNQNDYDKIIMVCRSGNNNCHCPPKGNSRGYALSGILHHLGNGIFWSHNFLEP